MAHLIRYFLLSCAIAGLPLYIYAQSSARDIRGPAAVTPLLVEPPAKLVVDDPLPDHLAQGRVVIQYYAQNIRILPVFGSAALTVSPRIGHLHITVDDGPWRWVDTSNEPLIINLLPAGEHHILIELADPTHKVMDCKKVTFTVPALKESEKSHH